MESFKAFVKDNLKREIEKHEQQIRLAKKIGRQDLIDKHTEQIRVKSQKLASL